MSPSRTTRWWASFRLRLALTMALVSTVVLVVLGIVVEQQAAVAGRERLRDQALERLDLAVAAFESNVTLTGGVSLSPNSAPDPVRKAARLVGERATYYDGATMWASERLTGQILLTVRIDGTQLTQERRDLRHSLLLAGSVAVISAFLLAWLVAGGLSGRIRHAARVLEGGISAGGRLPEPVYSGGRDEIAALTKFVDLLADGLAERIERERRFSADVAHELRTPVTALVSAAELLDPHDEVTGLVRNQVTRMRRLIEDLLELFRAESGVSEVDLAEQDLATAVHVVLEKLPQQPATFEVDKSATVLLEMRRLERIVSNLVVNAISHGGVCEVRVNGATIEISDNGEGFADELLEHGPRRFVRHSSAPGTGLGLTIVAAQAEVMGATLALSNRPEGGAQASVTFRTSQPISR